MIGSSLKIWSLKTNFPLVTSGEDQLSSSRVKEEDTPIPSYKKRYNMKKQVVAQHRTNLDLTNIAFKDKPKVIKGLQGSIYVYHCVKL
jgi:hypothetical protein